jgi:hypothetical protein
MDFLDPNKKRSTAIRLAVGHLLMVLLVVFGTYLLVVWAYGFGVDRKTGQVVRNGLVFFDTAPAKAEVLLNGIDQKYQTNTRQSLAEGDYSVELRKDGYRSWKHDFNLEGGTVERFMYPLLIPDKLTPTEVQTIDALPSLGLQSPDRRWVLLAQTAPFGTFTEYDLNSLKNEKPVSATLAFPAGVLKTAGANHKLELVEWSTDNKHILMKHIFDGGQEFVIFDRDNPAASVNVNQVLGQAPTDISLHDKQYDQLYLYTATGGVLQTADLRSKTVTPFLSGVLSFKSHGSDKVLYSEVSPADPAKARILLRDGAKTYTLRDQPLTATVPLDLATYNGNWYVIIGSDAEHGTYIYKNPVDSLTSHQPRAPTPISLLKTTGPITMLGFSQNARFIMVNSGQYFATYDFEKVRQYHYDIASPLEPTKPVWMDGNRILVHSGGKALMFDYDGLNQQTLVASDTSLPVFFDRDYLTMYTVSTSPSVATKYGFLQTFLRLPADR